MKETEAGLGERDIYRQWMQPENREKRRVEKKKKERKKEKKEK